MKSLIITTALFILLTSNNNLNAQNFAKANEIEISLDTEDVSTSIVWNTTVETNSSYFLLEESFDGKNFSIVGRTNAAGNSHFQRSYRFELDSDSAITTWYRLTMVLMGGEKIYSDILYYEVPRLSSPVAEKIIAQK